MIIIPPFIINSKESIVALTNNLIAISIFCYSIYFIWPITSTEILSQVDYNLLSSMHNSITFNFLHQNAFPSMHVAVSWLIGLVIIKEKPKFKLIIIFVITLIFLATFLTKQHYLVDSIAGLFLAYVGFWRYNKRMYLI